MQKERKKNVPGARDASRLEPPSPTVAAAAVATDVDDDGVDVGGRRSSFGGRKEEVGGRRKWEEGRRGSIVTS